MFDEIPVEFEVKDKVVKGRKCRKVPIGSNARATKSGSREPSVKIVGNVDSANRRGTVAPRRQGEAKATHVVPAVPHLSKRSPVSIGGAGGSPPDKKTGAATVAARSGTMMRAPPSAKRVDPG